MDATEAKQILFDASEAKMPRFRRDPHGEEPAHSPQQRIDALEDYLLLTAVLRSDLERARLWMADVLHKFVVDWEKLVGWETNLPGGKRVKDATQADITTAKRGANPTLWENISDLKHLIDGLSRQIRRLEGDDAVASRAYTFITGS